MSVPKYLTVQWSNNTWWTPERLPCPEGLRIRDNSRLFAPIRGCSQRETIRTYLELSGAIRSYPDLEPQATASNRNQNQNSLWQEVRKPP